MAGKCQICGKGVTFGRNVSHSKRHTSRTWRPNTQVATVTLNGKPKRIVICTRCLRSRHKIGL